MYALMEANGNITSKTAGQKMLDGALKALGRADDPIGRAMKIKLVLTRTSE